MMHTEFPLWTSILGNFGFPIAITVYLLLRFERKFEKLEERVMNLRVKK